MIDEADSRAQPSEEERRPPQTAADGAGPLLQRDYVIVLKASPCSPEEAMEKLRADFPRFSPAELARFSRPAGVTWPLDHGDTMQIDIRGFGECAVRVSHLDPQRLTLQTLEGHPEAGRITFGAHRDESGHLVCRIRSRARLRDTPVYAGYALLGRHAQTRVWVTFLGRLAEACGGGVLDDVIVSTDEIAPTAEDLLPNGAPTLEV